jgi:uncharacterized phiE125 gp8 family phage protein
MASKLITAPATEPVTVAEAKAHLRVDSADDDALITALIVSARQGAEHITGRALMPQTWELALDKFPRQINLSRAPLTSITSIKYLDESGVLRTMTEGAYLLDGHSEPARMTPAYGTNWPATRCQANAVLVQFVAGYTSAAAVPQEIKSWMLLRIGMLYENRESVAAGVTLSELPYVDRLLDAYKLWEL